MTDPEYADVQQAQQTIDNHAIQELSANGFTDQQAKILVAYFVGRPGAGVPTPPDGPH